MRSKTGKKLSKKEIDKILDNAAASFEVEGLKVTEDEKELLRKYFEGVYSEEQVLEIIRNKALGIFLEL